MIDFKIAIPTYNRPDTLLKSTIPLLEKHNIPTNIIHIFVHNQEQYNKYIDTVNKGYNVINTNTPLGKKYQLEFISHYFPENYKVVNFDDDVYELYECYLDNHKLQNKLIEKNIEITNDNLHKNRKLGQILKPLQNLIQLINYGYNLLDSHQYKLFGIYPVDNPFFMKYTTENYKEYTTTKLTYIVGCFYGYYNDRHTNTLHVENKEDYERSIRYFHKYNGNIRFDNITLKTNYYQGHGGLNNPQRWYDADLCAHKLTQLYPQYCKINYSSKRIDKYTKKPYTEITLTQPKHTQNTT
jgi:hypothetical protein